MKKHILSFVSMLILSSIVYAEETVIITIPATSAKTLEWQTGEPGKMEWKAAMDYCQNLALNGKTDWRLPKRDELQTLIFYDQPNLNPAADKTKFPNTHSSVYWSSTTDAYSKDHVWGVYFNDGDLNSYNKTNSYYARCVRGGQ